MEEDELDDLPTQPLVADSPDMLNRKPSVASPTQRKSRKPLAIVLLTLVLLVLAGSVGAWIVLFQPFSVPSITQPQQSFKDSQLGILLLYPSNWTSQVDRNKAVVHFYDSSRTGQVDIVVTTNTSDPNHSLQQKAGQLGLTAQKPEPPLTFAGTTWQQLQGSLQQEGASYTATLLVSVHNQHLYTISFLAPQSIYTQEEQYVFANMRSSFQFTS